MDFIRKLADSSARSIVLASLASRAGLTATDIAAGLKQADMYRSRKSIHGEAFGGAGLKAGRSSGRELRSSTVVFADFLVEPSLEDR